MRYTISSLFLSIYIIIIYMLLTRHATIADYFTTIRRLFRDCPATIPGMRREPCGNLRTVPERACRLSGWQIWQQERRAALARRAAGSAEDLRARARTRAAVSRRCGECLYLRRNCPLNARLCFMGILIYPRYKRAVYARFRGYFAAVQKIAPKNAGALHRAGDREKPRQASSLSGRVFTWSFSPRQ